MLRWAIGFFILALIAALFGFGGIAAGAAGIAKLLFWGFVILGAGLKYLSSVDQVLGWGALTRDRFLGRVAGAGSTHRRHQDDPLAADLAKARDVLKSIGLEDRDGNGVVEDNAGTEARFTVPLASARIARAGEQCTVLAYGAMVPVAVEAAEQAAERGWSVEVVDLRTLNPLDSETVLASVRKTGRVVVMHEAPPAVDPRTSHPVHWYPKLNRGFHAG